MADNNSNSGGGVVSAVSNAVGSIANIFSSKNEKDTAEFNWLSSNPTTFKWFFSSSNEKDNSGLIIIAVLSFVFIIVLSLVVLIKLKRNG